MPSDRGRVQLTLVSPEPLVRNQAANVCIGSMAPHWLFTGFSLAARPKAFSPSQIRIKSEFFVTYRNIYGYALLCFYCYLSDCNYS
jgi:hypothetical protein